MPQKISFSGLFDKIISILKKARIPYMIVGGLAVNYYGEPRFTADIDLVIIVDPKKEEKLINILQANKFKFREDTLKILLKTGNIFDVYDAAGIYRIDFWLPKTNFEKQAFSRKIEKSWRNKKLYFLSAEDLVLFKLLAGRQKDLADIEGILNRQAGKLDYKYLKYWAAVLGKAKELKKHLT